MVIMYDSVNSYVACLDKTEASVGWLLGKVNMYAIPPSSKRSETDLFNLTIRVACCLIASL